jgi:hypothetical protein
MAALSVRHRRRGKPRVELPARRRWIAGARRAGSPARAHEELDVLGAALVGRLSDREETNGWSSRQLRVLRVARDADDGDPSLPAKETSAPTAPSGQNGGRRPD